MQKQKGFTLVELLIVIGIIGVLAVTLMLALNPGEAQKKSRDAARLRDMQTLQATVELYLNDDVSISEVNVNSTAITGTKSQPCSTNWTTIDLCEYTRTVPLDPVNGSSRSIMTALGTPSTSDATLGYELRILNGNYEIRTYLEAEDNASLLDGDGGDDANQYEVFSGSNALL